MPRIRDPKPPKTPTDGAAGRSRRNDGARPAPRADPAAAAGEAVEVKTPPAVDQATRDAVQKRVAEKLLGIAEQHKDVRGTGVETSGSGDPRITERRNALSTLLAEKGGKFVDVAVLEAISPQVKADLRWLKDAERKDYSTAGSRQFGWTLSNMSGAAKVEGEFKARVSAGQAQAKEIVEGKRSFLSAADGSVIGAAFLKEPDQRAAALADVLLQFRAHVETKQADTNDVDARIDRIGPALVAEQRVLLAGADLDASDPAKVREYALLREVIASHPTSSVNSIFEARNAVGSMAKDGNSSGWEKPLDWVEEDVPPGATASAYKSIHHNFSKQTPKNIEKFVSEFLFRLGPESERPAVFIRLVDALKLAAAGEGKAATELVASFDHPEHKKVVAPLEKELAKAKPDEVAPILERFLARASIGDWEQFPSQYRMAFGEGDGRKRLASTLMEAKKEADRGRADQARAKVSAAAPGQASVALLRGVVDKLKSVPDDKLAEAIVEITKSAEVQALPDSERQALTAQLHSAATLARSYRPASAALAQFEGFVQAGDFAADAAKAVAGKPEAEIIQGLQTLFKSQTAADVLKGNNAASAQLRTARGLANSGALAPDEALQGFADLQVVGKVVSALAKELPNVPDAELKKKLDAASSDPSIHKLDWTYRNLIDGTYSGLRYAWNGVKPGDYAEAREGIADLAERLELLAGLHGELKKLPPEKWQPTIDAWLASPAVTALDLSTQDSLRKLLEKPLETMGKATPGASALRLLEQVAAAGDAMEGVMRQLRTLPEHEVPRAVAKAKRGDDLPELSDAALKLTTGELESASYDLSSATKARDAREAVASFLTRYDALKPLMDALSTAKDDEVSGKIKAFLDQNLEKNLGENVVQNLDMAARIYRAVCASQPTAGTLEAHLFKAGDATPEVADVIAKMNAGDAVGVLKELGEARLAMRDAVIATKTGYERHDLIRFDALLGRLTCEELGAAVDRVGEMKTNEQKAEALVAVQTALRSAVASGLHELKDPADPAARRGRPLDEVLKDVDAAVSSGRIGEDKYRGLMAEVSMSVARTVQNIRSFIDLRAAEIADAGVQLDPEFLDQFVKQSPLHYATALAEKGMRVGLKERVLKGDDGRVRGIENVEGMRVLNGVGPVVFTSVVFAENSKELARLGTTKEQLAVLYHLEEKKMVAVGGLFVDSAHAPGGNSHLNMYAMNNGIPVVALPELRTRYADFFKTAEKEGGVYVDDTGAEFKMMTVQMAVEQGLIPVADPKDAGQVKAAVEKLRPGMNRNITFLKPTSDGQAFEVAAKHDATISAQRGTRDVEIYIPQDEVKGIGKTCPTWEELATLGIHARHVAGEKGTVLALLSAHPELGKYVPKGSQVTPAVIKDMLRVAKDDQGKSLLDRWEAVWNDDPAVGVVDDGNFLRSAFYTDPKYRAEKREELQHATKELLTKALLTTDAKGKPKLTPDGDRIYQQLLRNPNLANDPMWILRSSFTAEDRPGKSGAGQYESYVDKKLVADKAGLEAVHKKVADAAEAVRAAEAGLAGGSTTQAQLDRARKKLQAAVDERNAFLGPARVQALIGVVESTWMPEPIENNVAEQFFLKHVGPTVAVQQTVDPDISGVMISRNLETGGRQEVTFQLVKGFGGGVDGGKTTEGVIGMAGARVAMTNGEPSSGHDVLVGDVKVDEKSMAELRDIVLKTERFFNEVIEKGKRYAVDMEVARDREDGWKIVQARVILVDK